MGFWNWFGGGGNAEVPFEMLSLDDVQERARRSEPAVGLVVPLERLDPIHANLFSDPGNPATLAALGACQLALGEYDKGLDTLNQAVFHDKEWPRVAKVFRIKGTTLDLYRNDPAKAVTHYDSAGHHVPNYPALTVFRAELAYRNGQKRELSKHLQSVLKLGLSGALGDAEAALHAEDHEAAVESLQVYHRVTLLELIASAS